MPFMSNRLLACWEEDRTVTHAPIDDFESFLWIIVWAVHAILENRGLLDPDSRALWNNFEEFSSTVSRVSVCRGILLRNWISERAEGPDAWTRWRRLITKLWNLRNDAEVEVVNLIQLQMDSPAALELNRRICMRYTGILLDAGEDDIFRYGWDMAPYSFCQWPGVR